MTQVEQLRRQLADASENMCRAIYEIMRGYRNEGVTDVDARDFFKAVLGEKYDFWAGLRVEWLQNEESLGVKLRTPHYLLLKDAAGNEVDEIDLRDETYEELEPEEQEALLEREKFRCRYGLWVQWPGFGELSPSEQEARLKQDPVADFVRVFSEAEYFLMTHMSLESPGIGIQCPSYNRKTSQLLAIWDALSSVKFYSEDGNEIVLPREGIMHPKSRSSRFTTTAFAFFLNKMSQGPKYTWGYTIDDPGKNGKLLDRFDDQWMSLPKWRRLSIVQGGKHDKFELSESHKGKAYEKRYVAKPNAAQFDLIMGEGYSNRGVFVGSIPKTLESMRLNAILHDEIGLCDTLSELFDRSGDTLKGEYAVIRGFRMLGGVTSKNKKVTDEIKKMFYRPALYNIFSLFVGIQHYSAYANASTGWTSKEDEARVIEEVIAKRKALQEVGDLPKLQNNYMMEAISPRDCFNVSTASNINQARIQARIEEIQAAKATGKMVIQRGWFRENLDDYLNPIWMPDSRNGGWHIYEHPDKASLGDKMRGPSMAYTAGADNHTRDVTDQAAMEANAGGGKLSLSCMLVAKTWADDIVAMYRYRHGDPRKDYLQMFLGALYYNCKLLPEYNKEQQAAFIYYFETPTECKATFPKGFFRKWGMGVPLAYRSTNSPRKIWIGVDNSGLLKEQRYENYVIPFCDRKVQHLPFIEVLDAVSDWDITNKRGTPDEGMALLILLLAMDWATSGGRKKPPEQAAAETYGNVRQDERLVYQRFVASRSADNALLQFR